MKTTLQKTLGAIDKRLYLLGCRKAEKLRLPQFLGIGAQKAGTSWLHANLVKHPGLFLPAKKELHYFDWHYSESLGSYAHHFDGAQAKQLCGEITPNYLGLADPKIAFIKKMMPACKLLLILRNPIDRAWSQAVMNLVRNEGREPESLGLEECRRYFLSERVRRRGAYLKGIRSWLRHFDESALKVEFFESLTSEPKQLLVRVFEFLGVPCGADDLAWNELPYLQIVHKGEGVSMPANIRSVLEEIYAEDIEKLYREFGDAVAPWRVGTSTKSS